ncbi:MAG: LysR family transcriptional regulator [Polyangiales bacterium]
MRFSPHPLTLRQLQYAVAVAEHRSFRRAAELCHVSQPALSAQVAQLEDALGVRLFERDRRRVMPTAAGPRSSTARDVCSWAPTSWWSSRSATPTPSRARCGSG